ncbi:chymotrypsin-1 [Nasonia vitripennis]|uniref:chymotrypsin n=1 Tax=Nasonia vitripennis TaxID=7425 RepID=A0A7M7GGX0_NASVI|nr:chymotrypsin-1 [Nasonia vitripennis]
MRFAGVSCLLVALLVGAFAAPAEKIVGGENANINDYPYQVSLRKSGKHFCGGSIISEKHIMTAAHCVRGIMASPFSDISVFTGTSSSSGYTGKSHRVKRADVHPGYSGTEASSYHNDIAILTLTSPVKFDAVQKKIDLPTRDVISGESAVITGWGIKKYPSNYVSPVLQKAAMSIIPSSRCTTRMYPLRLHGEQVCALQRKGVGACSGDSGGPLAVNKQVVGIASWVVPCGEGYPDVYTKVYAYKSWIQTILDRD